MKLRFGYQHFQNITNILLLSNTRTAPNLYPSVSLVTDWEIAACQLACVISFTAHAAASWVTAPDESLQHGEASNKVVSCGHRSLVKHQWTALNPFCSASMISVRESLINESGQFQWARVITKAITVISLYQRDLSKHDCKISPLHKVEHFIQEQGTRGLSAMGNSERMHRWGTMKKWCIWYWKRQLEHTKSAGSGAWIRVSVVSTARHSPAISVHGDATIVKNKEEPAREVFPSEPIDWELKDKRELVYFATDFALTSWKQTLQGRDNASHNTTEWSHF